MRKRHPLGRRLASLVGSSGGGISIEGGLLVSVHFPIVDIREFLGVETGKLARPSWPNPSPEVEFVRGFGGVRRRALGGLSLDDWAGEQTVCEARHVLRFTSVVSSPNIDAPLHVSFRRFVHDGDAVGRFDVGLASARQRPIRLREGGLADLVDSVLDLRVTIGSEERRRALATVGRHLAREFLVASSDRFHPHGHHRSWSRWLRRHRGGAAPDAKWTEAAAPLVVVEYDPSRDEVGALAEDTIRGEQVSLQHGLRARRGQDYDVWIVAGPRDAARVIRMLLVRLHAEKQTLAVVLRSIRHGSVSPPARTDASDRLQAYLRDAARRLDHLRGKHGRPTDPAGLVAQADQGAVRGDSAALLADLTRQLERLDVRLNIRRRARDLASELSDDIERGGRPLLFLSYAREDKPLQEELVTHLRALQRAAGILDIWTDDEIPAGADWREEILHAMERASVAVLLVTPRFLASAFVTSTEIPALLERRARDGMVLIPVIGRDCAWKAVPWLAETQVYPPRGVALWADGADSGAALARLVESIARRLPPAS